MKRILLSLALLFTVSLVSQAQIPTPTLDMEESELRASVPYGSGCGANIYNDTWVRTVTLQFTVVNGIWLWVPIGNTEWELYCPDQPVPSVAQETPDTSEDVECSPWSGTIIPNRRCLYGDGRESTQHKYMHPDGSVWKIDEVFDSITLFLR